MLVNIMQNVFATHSHENNINENSFILQPITKAKIETIIYSLKNKKSVGLNGIKIVFKQM